jgi:hypothetical protein
MSDKENIVDFKMLSKCDTSKERCFFNTKRRVHQFKGSTLCLIGFLKARLEKDWVFEILQLSWA